MSSVADIASLLTNVSMFKLTIHCQLEQEVTLDAYKGSTFHGGFGHALMAVSSELYKEVFEGKKRQNQTLKKFVLTPPITTKTKWQKGEVFSFGLTLFDDSTELLQQMIMACLYWQQLGIGPSRAHFVINKIESHIADGQGWTIYQKDMLPLCLNAPISLVDIINAQASKFNNRAIENAAGLLITVSARTRLRLQENNQYLDTAPSIQTLINNIFRRIKQQLLLRQKNQEADALYSYLPHCHDVNMISQNAYFADWSRFSKRNNRYTKMGGLLGNWSYAGELDEVIPWLAIGEWLHIGNKTSFGFGAYTWQPGFYKSLDLAY